MTGRLRVDPHVKLLDDQVVARAKLRGLDALVYAPHFTRLPRIRERAARFSDDELLVIPGREVFTGTWRERKHVLAIGLESPVPDFITLEGAMQAFERQGAAVLVPHPTFLTVSLSADDVERYRDRIHAVETYNPKHLPWHNRRAERLATAVDRPTFASSYAHLRGSVGEAWTEFETCRPTEADIVEAFRSAAPRAIDHRRGVAHRVQCSAEFGHLFYENSLSKAYLLWEGVKPTNPHHPEYGGRFDDVAAYGEPRLRSFQGD